jgi:tetratricopeptide (TPR) repeat protein
LLSRSILPVLLRPCSYLVLLLAGLCGLSSARAQTAPAGPENSHEATPTDNLSFRPSDALNASAFEHFYNLEQDRAVQQFGEILQRHPDDPFAVNHLLNAVLFRELYRMGVLNTGEYANDSFIKAAHNPPDPRVQRQIKDLVARAFALEEAHLSSNPNDIDFLYARGVTRAQFATYTGLVEHAWLSALRNAVGARHDHERVLELAPNEVQAKLIVGAHNYVVGSLPWGLKMAGSMVGLGGSKEKGLQYLEDCAAGSGETRVDGEILLVLFLRRERRFAEALPIARGLISAYPHNLVMALEEGNLLRASGRNGDAAEVYRKIWQAGKAGRYSGLHYETVALSLGELLRGQKDYAGAAAAYELPSVVPQADGEILRKSNLAAGEMYDLLHNRDQAVKRYQQVVSGGGDNPETEAARKYLQGPYRGE